MNWTEEIPSLSISLLENGNLRLEDKSYGEGAIVDVHPCQVRLMAERLAVVRMVSASDADIWRTDCVRAAALRADLERLIPWIEMIEARASHLRDNILGIADLGHEDVNIEVAQSSALVDIIEQVLKDAKAACAREVTRSHDVSRIEPDRNPIAPKSSEIGAFEELQKRVASTGPQGELL